MKRFILARWQDFTRAFTGWTGVALAALLGAVLGVGVFTVFYSGSTEYLGDDPASCANCHAMNEQYEGWLKGSHHDVATYNSCHAPHNDIVRQGFRFLCRHGRDAQRLASRLVQR